MSGVCVCVNRLHLTAEEYQIFVLIKNFSNIKH